MPRSLVVAGIWDILHFVFHTITDWESSVKYKACINN